MSVDTYAAFRRLPTPRLQENYHALVGSLRVTYASISTAHQSGADNCLQSLAGIRVIMETAKVARGILTGERNHTIDASELDNIQTSINELATEIEVGENIVRRMEEAHIRESCAGKSAEELQKEYDTLKNTILSGCEEAQKESRTNLNSSAAIFSSARLSLRELKVRHKIIKEEGFDIDEKELKEAIKAVEQAERHVEPQNYSVWFGGKSSKELGEKGLTHELLVRTRYKLCVKVREKKDIAFNQVLGPSRGYEIRFSTPSVVKVAHGVLAQFRHVFQHHNNPYKTAIAVNQILSSVLVGPNNWHPSYVDGRVQLLQAAMQGRSFTLLISADGRHSRISGDDIGPPSRLVSPGFGIPKAVENKTKKVLGKAASLFKKKNAAEKKK